VGQIRFTDFMKGDIQFLLIDSRGYNCVGIGKFNRESERSGFPAIWKSKINTYRKRGHQIKVRYGGVGLAAAQNDLRKTKKFKAELKETFIRIRGEGGGPNRNSYWRWRTGVKFLKLGSWVAGALTPSISWREEKVRLGGCQVRGRGREMKTPYSATHKWTETCRFKEGGKRSSESSLELRGEDELRGVKQEVYSGRIWEVRKQGGM